MQDYCIVVHGGACAIPKSQENYIDVYRTSIMQIVRCGYEKLEEGESAVDAVEAAIVALENDQLYNAGTGCCLTSSGTVEMDAMIMDGAKVGLGSVGCIDCVRNPISLARLVMEKSLHCMFVGNGARIFAESCDYPTLSSTDELVTQKALNDLSKYKDFNTALKQQMNVPTSMIRCETVGAVAVDKNGNIACGTSSGGIAGKLPGRIGDVPLVGCGGYANKIGAASCTGHGESLMKAVCCRNVVVEMENGASPFESAKYVLDDIFKTTKSCGGVICVNQNGEIGVYKTSEFMPWASIHSSLGSCSFRDCKM